MDGISLYAIRRELERYLPMKVQKIYHPSEKCLLISLWSREFKRGLVISLERNTPFFGFINEKPEMPKIPSGTCLALRNRLEGGILHRTRQEGLDRIIYFDFTGRDTLGTLLEYTLVFDAAGSPGIGLTCNGVTEVAISTKNRRLQLGESYYPPKSGKVNLLSQVDLLGVAAEICVTGQPAHRGLVSRIDGMGKDLALSIAAKMGLSENQPFTKYHAGNLYESLAEIKDCLMNGRFSPGVFWRESGEPVFGVFPLYHLSPKETFTSVLEGAAAYKDYLAYFEQQRALEAHVRSLYKKINRKVVSKFLAQKADLEKSLDFENFRIWAELINATGEELPGGHSRIKVLNYYRNPPEEMYVPLDPRFSSGENARRYYSMFAKLKRTQKVLERSLKGVCTHLEGLRCIEALLEQENHIDSLSVIEEKLMEIALEANVRLPLAKRKTDRKSPSSKRVFSYNPMESVEIIHGADGAILFAGKSAQGNEYLVRHLRKPGDIWLHARGVKGAHVLLRVLPGKALTAGLLNWAASIAAQRSQAKEAGKVEVDWVDAGNVKKPGGSPPGFVTYKGAKTVVVKTL